MACVLKINLLTDRVSWKGTAIGHVRPFIRCFSLELLNQLAVDLDFMHVYES